MFHSNYVNVTRQEICIAYIHFLYGTASAWTSDPGASVGRVRGRWILKILNRQPLDLKTTR
jgi:hypothetical protein